jgi:hypothetical protein
MSTPIQAGDLSFIFFGSIGMLYIFLWLVKAFYHCFMAFNQRELLRVIGLIIVAQIFFVSMKFVFSSGHPPSLFLPALGNITWGLAWPVIYFTGPKSSYKRSKTIWAIVSIAFTTCGYILSIINH